MNRINKASLLLGAVSITDVYINSHTIPSDTDKFADTKQKVIDLLNAKGWCASSGYFDSSVFEDFAISGSSYSKITSRDIFMHVRLDEKHVKDVISETDNEKLGACKFENIYLVFFNGGNAVILTSINLDNLNLSYEAYEQICRTLHKCFPLLYKDLVVDACCDYYSAMRTYLPETTQVKLLDKPDQDLSFELRIKNLTLTYSIYNHFIFDDHLYQNDSETETLFIYDECVEKMTKTAIGNIKIRYGYTHSFYLFENEDKRPYFESLYKLPLLNILANWAAIRAITLEIDNLSKACKCSLKGKFIISSFNKMKKYLLKIEDLYTEFDSYSTTNNPVNYNLIYLYKIAFGEIEHLDRLTKKRKQVYEFMSTISDQRIEHSSKFTNAILTIIACIAVFDVIEFNPLNLSIMVIILLIINWIRRFIQNKSFKL